MDDSELAAASARGDQEAFTLLFLRHREFVYSVAYKVMLNQDDALDVTQKVFMKLATCIGDFSGRGSFRGWLCTITTNAALSELRRPYRREIVTEPDRLPDQPGREPNPREHAERSERHVMITKAIEQLSPQQRAILLLQCHEDIGPAEIAGRLELKASQVRVQLRRAIVRLREIILKPSRAGEE